MPKTFGIQEIGAGRPVAVLVGEHAVEHEDLFAVRVVVAMKRRARLVANDGRHLPGLGRPDEMHALSPDRAARARRPLHRRGVDGDANREIAVDRLTAHALYGTRMREPEATGPADTADTCKLPRNYQ